MGMLEKFGLGARREKKGFVQEREILSLLEGHVSPIYTIHEDARLMGSTSLDASLGAEIIVLRKGYQLMVVPKESHLDPYDVRLIVTTPGEEEEQTYYFSQDQLTGKKVKVERLNI